MPFTDEDRQALAALMDQRFAAVLSEEGPLGKRLAGQSAAIEELRKGRKDSHGAEPSDVTAALARAEAINQEAMKRQEAAEVKAVETAIIGSLQDIHGLSRLQARMATDHLMRHRSAQFVADGADVVYVADDKTKLPIADYIQKMWGPQYLNEFVPPKRGANLRRPGEKGSSGKVQLTLKQVAAGEAYKRGLKEGEFEVTTEEE